jgi:hypothetical protein
MTFLFIIISGSTVLVRILAALHRRFRNLKTLGRAPLDEWSARRKGLYLHRTTQHRNTKTNIHASSGIRTHDPSNQVAKTYALHRAAIGIGYFVLMWSFCEDLMKLDWPNDTMCISLIVVNIICIHFMLHNAFVFINHYFNIFFSRYVLEVKSLCIWMVD